METKNRSGWGLPVIVAVGVFAYYCATLKLSAAPQQRRREILQRLHGGTSPRTLLEEGYTRAELVDAGVPRTSLALLSSPSASLATAESRDGRSVSQREASQGGRSGRPASAECGFFSWLYGSLVSVVGTIQAASETIVENLRGRGTSPGTRDGKATGFCDTDASAKTPPVPPAELTSSGAARPTSVRLAPVLLRGRGTVEKPSESAPSEHSCPRAPGGAVQVRIAALSAAVTRGYTEESCTCRYPLDVMRFLHEDGSRLSIMAESCAAVESDGGGVVTTAAYVQRSLARARAAADASKAYFKVKLSTAARNIATTVMESYVNAHVGPSPVVLACFYLVSHGVAYIIQLQTHTGVYEERLSDLLYTAQSARLYERDSSSPCGHNVFQMQIAGVESRYFLDVPVDLVVRAPAQSSSYRSTLTLSPSSGGRSSVLWNAKVEIRPANSTATASLPGASTLLRDAHVLITLTLHHADHAPTTFPEPLKQVTARRASTADAATPVDAYASSSLTLLLPPPEQFCTKVCEHPHDPFVTLFIAAAVSSETDLFELELRCMNDIHKQDLCAFFAYLETLFLTPSGLKRTANGAGQAAFAVDGLAVAPPETSLRIDGVQVREGSWLVARWLYADSAVFPRELEQYRRTFMGEVSVG
ncbi:hypothetical protein ABB37_04100 [Leptomonas pyrrhocoris]|uniref:Uncharacterized protein n=1 Tax=Leptomonas pyrrhocoris TaxID=157538 RepID=A0A0N0DWN8_LEPPY|nr:hypothetical protein ABB37_04100 [Leptomonas pyrrhocoris]KPA81842.1 hypothetical protein ABB37_04100 [Leptomonas pyrrhocoris]|eukprot:XP_015660281.1 hypothetical protein ABB37_04100 [Leptomonas pyrrhocoris]